MSTPPPANQNAPGMYPAGEGSKWRPTVAGQRADGLRRVKNGLKLAAKDALAPDHWLARRLLQIVEATFDVDTLQEGFEYGRLGQTTAFEILPGRVDANVQGRAPRPYRTTVRFPDIAETQWERLLGSMAAEAMYLAMLPAGDVPETMGELWQSQGVALFPIESGVLRCECTCREAMPCKHAAAVALLCVEHLDRDPLAVFTWHGLPATRLVDRLRQTRAMMTHGVATTHADPMISETQDEPMPLEMCLDDFWRPGPRLYELEQAPPPQHVAHALLRRLGPSPLKGRFPLAGLLASIYDSVAEAAIRIRDHAEQIDTPPSCEE